MNNAVINFLFNSQGALKEINNFKTNFSKSIDAISNSAVGKFGRIGTVLGSIFSVKTAVNATKDVKKFQDKYGELPLDKLNQFANGIAIMNGNLEDGTNEALDFVGSIKDGLSQLKTQSGIFADPVIRGLFSSQGLDITVNDSVFDVIDKIRQLYKSGAIDENMQTLFFSKLGINNSDLFAYFKQTDEEWEATRKAAEKMGGATGEQIQALKKWNRALAELQGRFRRFGDELLKGKLTDGINLITKALDWFLNQNEGVQNAVMGIIASFLFGGPVLKEVSLLFSGLFSIVKAGFNIFKMFFLLLGSPFGVIIALAGLIWALSNNFLGLRSSINETLTGFDDWIDSIRENHGIIASFLDDLSLIAQLIANPDKAWEILKQAGTNIFGDKKDWKDIDKFVADELGTRRKEDAEANRKIQKEIAEKGYTQVALEQTGLSDITNSAKNYANNIDLGQITKLKDNISNFNIQDNGTTNITVYAGDNADGKQIGKDIASEIEKRKSLMSDMANMVKQYSNSGTALAR